MTPMISMQTQDGLGDFRTDKRVLVLSSLAVPVGLISAGIAKPLLWLIAVITNLAFFHRLGQGRHWPAALILGGGWSPCRSRVG
jgi:hypothetical protein